MSNGLTYGRLGLPPVSKKIVAFGNERRQQPCDERPESGRHAETHGSCRDVAPGSSGMRCAC
jgi:hypothetical protein